MSSSLENITEKLLSNSISIAELKSTLIEYKSLLLSATSLDLNRAEHQTDIKLENGIAIGLSWAASCLDDTIRTRKFIRGTKLAIDQKLTDSKKPVHLLYAGTGPFATLILPLLSHYSEEELHVTLLDVNPSSIDNVSRIIGVFGFENQVNEIRCADATKVHFKNASTFDILLSETMQHALQSELQVVITGHLINQMKEDVILIPQSIDLELVSFSSHEKVQIPLEIMGVIMKVDKNFLRTQHPILSNWEYKKQFKLPGSSASETEMLAISTTIKVFGNERIEWSESGLTVPKLLALKRDFLNKEFINLKYVIDLEPRFELEY
jgi:predicted RNA methylase